RSIQTYTEIPTEETTMSTTPDHPGRALFVNLPVRDLHASTAYLTRLVFAFNPLFTDQTATCMLVGEQAFVMLLSRERFADFSTLPIADPTTHTPALYCFSVDSREQVDEVGDAAVEAGGTVAGEPMDHGFMYSRSFFDL